MATKKRNWSRIKPGTWFTAYIYGNAATGRIQKEENEIFLCQNVEDGSECNDKLGFKYSWSIRHGSNQDIKEEDVTGLKILVKKPASFKIPKIEKKIYVGSNEVHFQRGEIVVGCTTIPNKIVRQIYKKLKK